jgi:predicted metalloprotease with PDZ domain
MAVLADRVLDLGLTVLDTEATAIHICSSEPASFAAVAGVTLGNKTLAAGGIGAPAARTPSGRKVTVAAFSDGSVTGTGTASHYAVVDGVNSRLLAASTLSASQSVTSGNTFSLDAFDIGIPGPA